MNRDRSEGDFRAIVLSLAGDQPIALTDVQCLKVKVLLPQMRKRGLLALPPKFLGYGDIDHWQDCHLDALACDALEWAIIRRLASLVAKAEEYANIDGLIVANVRNFLSHLQASQDPIGHATYKNLRSAAAQGLDAGWLASPIEDSPPHAEQPLHSPGAAPKHLHTAAEIRQRVTPLSEPLRQDVLELGQVSQRGREAASRTLQSLLSMGLCVFTVSDVVRAIVQMCRSEVFAMWSDQPLAQEEGPDDNSPESILFVGPEAFDSYFDWRDFVRTTHSAIGGMPGSTSRRSSTLRVFDFLVGQVEADRLEGLTRRELGRQLGLPRSTINDYIQLLHGLIVKHPSDKPGSDQLDSI